MVVTSGVEMADPGRHGRGHSARTRGVPSVFASPLPRAAAVSPTSTRSPGSVTGASSGADGTLRGHSFTPLLARDHVDCAPNLDGSARACTACRCWTRWGRCRAWSASSSPSRGWARCSGAGAVQHPDDAHVAALPLPRRPVAPLPGDADAPQHPAKPSQEPPGRICLGFSAPNHTLLPNSNRAEGTFLPTLPALPSAPRTSARGARQGPAGGYATRPSRRSSTVKSCGDVDADIAASRLITPSRNRPTRCWSNVCIP